MKMQYIKALEKSLTVSGQAKREILRDLEEIFASAREHGETEAVVAAAALVFAALAFLLHALMKGPMLSVSGSIIGGADEPTVIWLANPAFLEPVSTYLILGVVAVLVFVVMVVSLLHGRKRDKNIKIRKNKKYD